MRGLWQTHPKVRETDKSAVVRNVAGSPIVGAKSGRNPQMETDEKVMIAERRTYYVTRNEANWPGKHL